jgi:hypothetical protein
MLPGGRLVNPAAISDLVKPIRERWIAAGATPRGGASAEDLKRFETKYGVALPADFETFYRGVDGMPPNEIDDEWIRWWPIAEVQPVVDEAGLTSIDRVAYAHHFIFADWSLWACAYAVDLFAGATHGTVVIASWERPTRLCATFGEFLDLYVARSRRLYGTQP